nr:MAG TPA: hypothetical protein [Caudoviricetes sp.]
MGKYGRGTRLCVATFIALVWHESCQVNLSPQPPLISGGSGIFPSHI